MLSLNPIGFYRTDSCTFAKDTLPRQAGGAHTGSIILLPNGNFEVALQDLNLFSHIWMLFWFHEACNWRPKVQPPKSIAKRGVFATRSPHRPNPIGISSVELIEVRGRTLIVRGADVLDNTPILDIKPYIPSIDSHPKASSGWLDEREGISLCHYEYIWSEEAFEQISWLYNEGIDMRDALEKSIQSMGLYPSSANRVNIVEKNEKETVAVKAYRTWRVLLRYPTWCDTQKEMCAIPVTLLSIYSGYHKSDLDSYSQDKWGDKEVHRKFSLCFAKKAE